MSSSTEQHNEQLIFRELTSVHRIPIAPACGILANIFYESRYNPSVAEIGSVPPGYAKKLASGQISKSQFSSLYKGFGICQWTDKGRKAKLYDYTMSKQNRLGITTMRGQVSFLIHELKSMVYSGRSLYDVLRSYPNNEEGAKSACKLFCTQFERPANPTGTAHYRAPYAAKLYNKYKGAKIQGKKKKGYEGSPQVKVIYEPNKSIPELIRVARSQLGKKYMKYTNGPTTFDSVGFIQYVFEQVGYKIDRTQVLAESLNHNSLLLNNHNMIAKYQRKGKPRVIRGKALYKPQILPLNSKREGDVLTYNDRGTSYAGIYVGAGKWVRILGGGSVSETKIPTSGLVSALRFLPLTKKTKSVPRTGVLSNDEWEDAEEEDITPEGGGGSNSNTKAIGEDFSGLTVLPTHETSILRNLSLPQGKYGYVIDLTHGGKFRFMIPDSYTESAGVSWEDISLAGRSASIKSYDHTGSRNISVSLSLYAGAGVYEEVVSNPVDVLYRDIQFLQSLEYPDYSISLVSPPPLVQLLIGKINLVGVITSLSTTYKKPIDAKGRSYFVDVSFTVTQVTNNPPDYRDIRQGHKHPLIVKKSSTHISKGGRK